MYHAIDVARWFIRYNEMTMDIQGGEPLSLLKLMHLLKNIFDVFGEYSAWGLKNKTQKETPWIEATKNSKILNCEISIKTIKEFFRENYMKDE